MKKQQSQAQTKNIPTNSAVPQPLENSIPVRPRRINDMMKSGCQLVSREERASGAVTKVTRVTGVLREVTIVNQTFQIKAQLGLRTDCKKVREKV
jgi:hypothetical protein